MLDLSGVCRSPESGQSSGYRGSRTQRGMSWHQRRKADQHAVDRKKAGSACGVRSGCTRMPRRLRSTTTSSPATGHSRRGSEVSDATAPAQRDDRTSVRSRLCRGSHSRRVAATSASHSGKIAGMFTEDRDKWDVLLGVVVVAIVAVGIFASGHQQPQQAHAEQAAATEPATPRVDMQPASVKPVSTPSIAVAYECTHDGQRILSDQPCGADASIRRIAEPNRMDAQDTRALYSPVYVNSQQGSGTWSAGQGASTSPACDSIEAQIDSINSRMRHAYTSWQGERFRERLRELSRQRYEAKCIR